MTTIRPQDSGVGFSVVINVDGGRASVSFDLGDHTLTVEGIDMQSMRIMARQFGQAAEALERGSLAVPQ